VIDGAFRPQEPLAYADIVIVIISIPFVATSSSTAGAFRSATTLELI
jgi:hypothetical protein